MLRLRISWQGPRTLSNRARSILTHFRAPTAFTVAARGLLSNRAISPGRGGGKEGGREGGKEGERGREGEREGGIRGKERKEGREDIERRGKEGEREGGIERGRESRGSR